MFMFYQNRIHGSTHARVSGRDRGGPNEIVTVACRQSRKHYCWQNVISL